jgi:hypothetical protein
MYTFTVWNLYILYRNLEKSDPMIQFEFNKIIKRNHRFIKVLNL